MASDTQERYLLAVYGTLKENFPNYFYYLNPLKPIFSGLVKIPFQMYTNGGFPLLFPAEELHSIYIEIFEIDEKILHKIDLLEGVPNHYSRKSIFLDELKAEVLIYVITNREPFGELIANGLF
ncbi:MAG TPA: gamma-glutamylcyclotransferase family protein [Candidatus Bathyarchaeia archaeon]|nr:gamma-glutamylcyclotransferase family protein [Candidatus Bathyarchaeia archaeon]